MDIEQITSLLIEDEYGIYRNPAQTALTYPSDGNARCFQLEDNSFWFKHRNQCIISMIKRFTPEGLILDIGGGNGYVTKGLLDQGLNAALLEPGPVGAYNAKVERKIPTVICSTLENANFQPSTINAISCFDVIEHIQDDREFINQIGKVLKSGGLLYGTVPAYKWLWSGADVRAKHYKRYTLEDISLLLKPEFELLFTSYLFAPLVLPIFVSRRMPYLLRFARQASALPAHVEHGTEGKNSKILDYFLWQEYKKIAAGAAIKYGTSCLFTARKL
jgi:SAM-dependent methyltransferase